MENLPADSIHGTISSASARRILLAKAAQHHEIDGFLLKQTGWMERVLFLD
jgi:hypothetical protein